MTRPRMLLPGLLGLGSTLTPSVRCEEPECYRLKKRNSTRCWPHSTGDCPICLEVLSLWYLRCRHGVCRECLSNLQTKRCPMCRDPINDEDLPPEVTLDLNYSCLMAKVSAEEDERRALMIREWPSSGSSRTTPRSGGPEEWTLIHAYLEKLGLRVDLPPPSWDLPTSSGGGPGGPGTFGETVLAILYAAAENYYVDDGPIEEVDGPIEEVDGPIEEVDGPN